MPGICFNEDSSNFLMSFPQSCMTEAGLRDHARRNASGQVRRVLYNLNGQRAIFASTALEPIWKDSDIREDGQVIHHTKNGDNVLENLNAKTYVRHAKYLHDQGINPGKVWLETTRECGREAWISVRMNDVHDADIPDSYMHGRLWREHPDYLRAPYETSWLGKCLDYAQKDVAETMLNYVRELAELFDFDGIELDFTRFFPHLRPGYEILDAQAITDLVRKIRGVLNDAAVRRNHPVQLGVHMAGQPEQVRRQGLDFITWAEQGLIDVMVIANFWPAPDSDMPIELWKRLLGDMVELDASLEVQAQAFPGIETTLQTPELLAGLAEQYLYRGADKVYFFNLMYGLTGLQNDEKTAEIQATLGEQKTAGMMRRRHYLGACNCEAIGTLAPWPLPCRPEPSTGIIKALRINVGGMTAGRRASVLFGFDAPVQDGLELYVNGQICTAAPEAADEILPGNVKAQRRYPLPDGLLHDGDNVAQFRWKTASPSEARITWFEFDIL